MTKKCALYVRVSTQEQKNHGLSVDSQIQALRDYCEAHGYIIYKVYNDAGLSARKSYKKRPALLEMVEDCQAGKIDLILMTKLDRFFRSVKDYYEVMSQIGEIPWRTIWEDYETETSSGVFKVNIMLSVAQSEADRTSERIRAINQYKRDRGDYLGKAPIGYKQDHGKLIIDPEKGEGMKALLETYVKTASIKKAMEIGLEHGLAFDRLTLLKLIRNPAYCGEASGGYKCEPLINREDHELILQHIGTHARKPKVEDRVYLFSGLLKCPYCGYRMSGHAVRRTHSDGSEVVYLKYECARHSTTKMDHPHVQIVEHTLEEYLLDHMASYYEDHVEEIKVFNENAGFDEAAKQKKSLESRLSRLATLYEDGDLDVATYRSKRDKIKDQISQIRFDPIPEPAPLPHGWKLIYEDLDADHRRTFWRSIIKDIVVNKGGAEPFKINFL